MSYHLRPVGSASMIGLAGEQVGKEAHIVGVIGHHEEVERPGQLHRLAARRGDLPRRGRSDTRPRVRAGRRTHRRPSRTTCADAYRRRTAAWESRDPRMANKALTACVRPRPFPCRAGQCPVPLPVARRLPRAFPRRPTFAATHETWRPPPASLHVKGLIVQGARLGPNVPDDIAELSDLRLCSIETDQAAPIRLANSKSLVGDRVDHVLA